MTILKPTVRIITRWYEFEQLERSWDQLLTQSDADTLFLTWNWVNCWRKTAKSKVQPYIILLEQTGSIIGIAPFYVQAYKLINCISYNALKCVADQGIGSEYANFIVSSSNSSSIKKALWDALIEPSVAKNWDFIWLTNIAGWTPGGKSLLTALEQQPLLHYNKRTVEFAATPLAQFDKTPLTPFSKEVIPSLSKSLRTNIKQTRKQLEKRGNVNIQLTQQPAELPQHLDTLFTLHNKRWESAGLTGSFARRPELGKFYQAFTPQALRHNQLRLLRLEVNGEIQAMQIGYVYNKTFLAIQEGFNPDFVAGAGQVLRHASFQHCHNEGLEIYDFLGGYTNHKRRWLAHKNIGCHLFIWQHKYKNLPFKYRDIWPTGRYLNQTK
ncbi:MAG: hypothetical protein ACI86X_001004 [Moritella sp.]|jgi:hypothetical protein